MEVLYVILFPNDLRLVFKSIHLPIDFQREKIFDLLFQALKIATNVS